MREDLWRLSVEYDRHLRGVNGRSHERGDWVQIKVRLSEDLGRRLREKCAERGETVVGAIRGMIGLWVGEDLSDGE